MSTTETIKELKVSGVLTDADAAKITVIRTDTSANVVDDVDMTRLSLGRYYHSWTDPAFGLTYTVTTSFTVGGETYTSVYSALGTPEPGEYPVTVAEFKDWHRLDDAEAVDAQIEMLLAAATDYVEAAANRRFKEKTERQVFPRFNVQLMLDYGPVVSLESVQYHDADGDLQTINANDYSLVLDGVVGKVRFDKGFSFPNTESQRSDAIVVNYTAGYADSEDYPKILKPCILSLASNWYEHRESVNDRLLYEVPFAVRSMIDMVKNVRI